MGLRFPPQIHGQYFFVTTTFNGWQPLGNIPGMYEELSASLAFCLNKYGAVLVGYVLMPTHIHLLLHIDGGKLGSFMRDFKKYIAQKSARELGIKAPAIWMPRYDRLVIVSEKVLRTKIIYMHNNPVKAELAAAPEDWIWSSASAYAGSKGGVLPIFKDWA